MILNTDEYDKVEGEIYKIINLSTNKCYIGQTRTHRLNHKKYRPFGFLGRFKDHISEAFSNKKNQSRYLNSSILKYGVKNFKCELIHTCKVNELDEFERYYISKYNTKYPNGYNLTDGGQGAFFSKDLNVSLDEVDTPIVKKPRDFTRSEHTKSLIAKRLKDYTSDIAVREKQMEKTQRQHTASKFERFRHVKINTTNIENYIFIINNYTLNYKYVRIVIDKVKANFIGKYEDIHSIKERAVIFIKELIKWQCDQIAGTPLEPLLPLTHGNICEELG